MLTRPNAAKHINAIGVLDIGTSKTACIIVSAPGAKSGLRRREGMRILGFGCKPSRGLKAGVVIDHDGAEQATRAAIMQAEQMAGVTIDEVFLAVTVRAVDVAHLRGRHAHRKQDHRQCPHRTPDGGRAQVCRTRWRHAPAYQSRRLSGRRCGQRSPIRSA